MPTSEDLDAANPVVLQKPQPIASRRHLSGFLLIGAGVVALGFLAQHASTASSPGQLGQHSQAIQIYLAAMLMDWALFYYCWAGVHRRGGNLETLSGGRWSSWKGVAVDLAVALPFWVVWEGAAYGVHCLLGTSHAKTVDSLLPQSLLEIVLWIATSVTAGFCEEMAFRGYVQRQFHAFTRNIVLAVIGQGVVFGLFHAYQGWKNVVVISILGMMFGALAGWRRNLRANIIVHSWADVWSGWLQFVVWR